MKSETSTTKTRVTKTRSNKTRTIPDWLCAPDCALQRIPLRADQRALLNDVVQSLPPLPEHPPIRVYNKLCHPKRRTAFFADDGVEGYRYSGQTMPTTPPTPELQRLLADVNAELGASYNGILVNYYADGRDSIGAHSDDERALDPNVGVAVLSIGSRILRFHHKDSGDTYDYQTTADEMIVMRGAKFQHNTKHSVPATAKNVGSRISFTFRRHACIRS